MNKGDQCIPRKKQLENQSRDLVNLDHWDNKAPDRILMKKDNFYIILLQWSLLKFKWLQCARCDYLWFRIWFNYVQTVNNRNPSFVINSSALLKVLCFGEGSISQSVPGVIWSLYRTWNVIINGDVQGATGEWDRLSFKILEKNGNIQLASFSQGHPQVILN